MKKRKDSKPFAWLIWDAAREILVPEMEADRELCRRFHHKARVRGDLTEPRNTAHHRKYWAGLAQIKKAKGLTFSADMLHRVIKVQLGYIAEVQVVDGVVVTLDESISFESMDQAEFDDFYQNAEEWCLKTFGIGFDRIEQEDAA